MNDTEIRERDIDSSARLLMSGAADYTPEQWRRCAAISHGRTADVYARCARLAENALR